MNLFYEKEPGSTRENPRMRLNFIKMTSYKIAYKITKSQIEQLRHFKRTICKLTIIIIQWLNLNFNIIKHWPLLKLKNSETGNLIHI